MTAFQAALQELLSEDFAVLPSVFGSEFDAQWIDEAVALADEPTQRKRKLPTERLIWLPIGMALWRDVATEDVASALIVRPDAQGQRKISKAGACLARQRLGSAPIQHIFVRSSQYWGQLQSARTRRWQGLQVFASDGTVLNVPDSPDNREHFGGPSNQHGPCGYPQVRLMVTLDVASHLVVDAAFGAYQGPGSGEQSLCRGMAARLPDESLWVFDGGLFSCSQWYAHQSAGSNRHWLGRARGTIQARCVEVLGPDDELADFHVPADVRREHPEMPAVIRVRVLRRVNSQGETIQLMTSLVDAERYRAEAIWAAYLERWQSELSYRESKIDLLDDNRPLRSMSPDGIAQELWGTLLAYNLVRWRMAQAGAQHDLDPRRLSFKRSLWLVSTFCAGLAWMVRASKAQTLLDQLDEQISQCLIPEETRSSAPREVKQRRKSYPIKKRQKPSDAATN